MNSHQMSLESGTQTKKAYIGNTFSSLNEAEMEEVRRLIDLITPILVRAGFKPFISMDECPPRALDGVQAYRLWLRLRKEMADSHLFILIYAGRTEGGVLEQCSAEALHVPFILLRNEKIPRNEMTWHPDSGYLGEIVYTDAVDGSAQLEQLLDNQIVLLNQRLEWLRMHRKVAEISGQRISEKVRRERVKRGWSRAYLGSRAGMSEDVVKAVEEDYTKYNPTHLDIVALLAALDAPYDPVPNHLFDGPGIVPDEMVVTIVLEEDWSFREYWNFRETFFENYKGQLTKEELRQMMRMWKLSL